MPTYLTAQEYVTRFGEQETINLTDENRTGTYDSAKVEAAITNAEQEADGYLGKRYTLPLSETPAIVKSIVGSLARYDLFSNNRPEAVEKQAAIARSQLKDIARGLMTLPGATGLIDEQDSSRPSSGVAGEAPATVFSDTTLSDFGVGSGGYNANWRA